MKIAIIGASFAGLSAALECRVLYPQARITIVDREKEVGYFPNALNWQLKEQIRDWSEAKSQLFYQVAAEEVNWFLGWEVSGFDWKDKSVCLRHADQQRVLSYDYLILAMGAGQSWDRQAEDLSPKIIASKSLAEMLESQEKLAQATAVTVVGAGQIGLESLDALSRHPYQLRLIEAQKWPLAKYFDQEMVEWMVEELAKRQIVCHFGETVDHIQTNSEDRLVLTTVEGSYYSDYMVLGTNFRPNTDLLEGQLLLQADGSVQVDDYLQTSQPAVFAVGDLIQVPIAFFGQSYLPMINHAVLTGRLVAHNLLEQERKLAQVERMVSSRVFGRTMTSVGLTEKEASLWLDTKTVRVCQAYSQWQDELMDFKLIVSQQDGRLLGGQLVSQTDHTGQMNLLALAISQQLTVYDLFQQSWLYLPDRTAMVPFLFEAAHRSILEDRKG